MPLKQTHSSFSIILFPHLIAFLIASLSYFFLCFVIPMGEQYSFSFILALFSKIELDHHHIMIVQQQQWSRGQPVNQHFSHSLLQQQCLLISRQAFIKHVSISLFPSILLLSSLILLSSAFPPFHLLLSFRTSPSSLLYC